MTYTIQRQIGARIRAARHERRLTLAQLARRVRINESSLSRIEGGKQNCRVADYARIAKALGTPLVSLLSEGE